MAGVINQSDVIVIFINQLREKVGIMFGNPETTTGGRALKFYSSIRIDIRKAVQNSKNKLEILAMATQQGAEIPINAQKKPATDANGNIVLSKLIPEALFELQ